MTLSRREFITYTAASSSLMVTIPLLNATPKDDLNQQSGWCVYVEIAPDNKITISSPVQDMGQHMKTTGPMMIAEELDADWSLVSCITSSVFLKKEGDKIEYDYADMSTGGSHAVRNNREYMRHAGAMTRMLLIHAASMVWKVSADKLITKNSFVINPANQEKLSYGALAEIAAKLDSKEITPKYKNPKDYHILGKDITTVDINEIVSGKPLFGIDMKMDNMLHAVIQRAPFYFGKIQSYSDEKTLKINGVVKTLKINLVTNEKNGRKIISEGVAVVAKNFWSALKGREALDIQWKQEQYQDESSEKILADFKQLCNKNDPKTAVINDGDIQTALNKAQKIFEHEFSTQHLAHLCMEPFNAVVEVKSNSATIITGNQNPKGVNQAVAEELGLSHKNVTVIPTRMGGGFGRRWQTDFVREATKIARHFKQPVKLQWTREDDVSQDYFGQAVSARVKAGIDENGKIMGWHNRQAQIRGGVNEYCFPQGLIKNYRIDRFSRKSGTDVGAWRGPGHMQSCFITESMLDIIAHDQQQDPLKFRLDLLGSPRELEYKGYGANSKSTQRMAKCYQQVATMAKWNKKRPEGVGLGIAGHFTFGSYAAFVVEYDSREKHRCKISNVWGAIDCGLALNPNHIRNQMEGGFIDGLNAALYNNVRIKNGSIINTNFDQLHFMRLRESPQNFKVAIIKNDFPPTGVGEPPTAPAAAALANAIFSATGNRQTQLPLKLS